MFGIGSDHSTHEKRKAMADPHTAMKDQENLNANTNASSSRERFDDEHGG